MGRPGFESSLSKGVLLLIIDANGLNGVISLTQTFNRILFYVRNGRYFGIQKTQNGDRGTIVFTAALFASRVLFYQRIVGERVAPNPQHDCYTLCENLYVEVK